MRRTSLRIGLLTCVVSLASAAPAYAGGMLGLISGS